LIEDSVPYDQIQDQGHVGQKLWKWPISNSIFSASVCNQKTNGELWFSKTISNFNWTDLWYASSFDVTWPSNFGCSTFGKQIFACYKESTGLFMLLIVNTVSVGV